MKRRIMLLVAALTLVFAFTGLTGCMYIDGNDGQWHSWGPNCNDPNFTGMDCNEYGWWYFRNGVIDWNYTGMACNEYGWWYFENGQINWNYTGMACNEWGWWYYQNGRLDWNYTGWGNNMYGTWLYWNGNVAFWYTGEYGGYNVVGGHREGAVSKTTDIHVHEWVDDYEIVHHDDEYIDYDIIEYDDHHFNYWLICSECKERIWQGPKDYDDRDYIETDEVTNSKTGETIRGVRYTFGGEEYFVINTKYTREEIESQLAAKKEHMDNHPECKTADRFNYTDGWFKSFDFDWDISCQSQIVHHHDKVMEAYDEQVYIGSHCRTCGIKL